jgi:hypothetical protein
VSPREGRGGGAVWAHAPPLPSRRALGPEAARSVLEGCGRLPLGLVRRERCARSPVLNPRPLPPPPPPPPPRLPPSETEGPITIHYNSYEDGGKVGTPKTMEVDLVIGADGANSRVAKEIDAGEYDYAIAFQERIRIPGRRRRRRGPCRRGRAGLHRVACFVPSQPARRPCAPAFGSLLGRGPAVTLRAPPSGGARLPGSLPSAMLRCPLTRPARAPPPARPRPPDDKMKYYENLAEMYVGDDVSPDFYGWVFPKYDHVAVGTGTVVNKTAIKQYQQATRWVGGARRGRGVGARSPATRRVAGARGGRAQARWEAQSLTPSPPHPPAATAPR